MAELAEATRGKAGTIHPATVASVPPTSPAAEPIPEAIPQAIPEAVPEAIPQAIPQAIPVEKSPEPAATEPSGATSRLITSRQGSSTRKLVTGSVPTLTTGRVGASGDRHSLPGSTSRLNQVAGRHHDTGVKKFGIFLAFAVPILLLVVFLISRLRS